MSATPRLWAWLNLGIAALGWSLAPIFIRMLSGAYDPITQGFVRYASAAVVLAAICLTGFRKEFLKLLFHPGPLLGLALVVVVHQYVWTAGCYGSNAVVANLITKLGNLFVVLFAFLLFKEERSTIRNPLFLIGTAISLASVPAVLAGDPDSLAPKLDVYSVLLLLTALCWAVYAVWAKHLVLHAQPVPVFAVTALYASAGLGLLSMAAGEPSRIAEASLPVSALAFISGAVSIGMAHPCFHYAQKHLGSAFCSSMNLTHPLITYLLALSLLPGETMTWVQWAGGTALVAGTLLVIEAGRRARQAPLVCPP